MRGKNDPNQILIIIDEQRINVILVNPGISMAEEIYFNSAPFFRHIYSLILTKYVSFFAKKDSYRCHLN